MNYEKIPNQVIHAFGRLKKVQELLSIHSAPYMENLAAKLLDLR